MLSDVAGRVDALKTAGVTPGLATILVGDDDASAGYIRMKQAKAEELGMFSPHLHLPADAAPGRARRSHTALRRDPDVHAMLVQHPAPPQIDYEAAIAHMHPDKDVDGLHPFNMGRLALVARARPLHAGRGSRPSSPTTRSRSLDATS